MKKIITVFLLSLFSVLLVSCPAGIAAVYLNIRLYVENPEDNSLLSETDLDSLIVTSNINVHRDYTLSPHLPKSQNDEEGNYYILLTAYIGAAHTDAGIKKVSNSYHEKLRGYYYDISDPVGNKYKPYHGRDLQTNYEVVESVHAPTIKYRIKLEKN